jgi:hypothetical protein
MAAEVPAEDVESVAANPVEPANRATVIVAAHRSVSERAMCRELVCGLVRIDSAQP